MSIHFRHGQWVEAEAGEYGQRLDLGTEPKALTASRPHAGRPGALEPEPEKPRRSRKKADPREGQSDQ